MNRYLYLNLVPESLVASMLPPEEYGKYLAVGLHRRSNEQAIFIELEPGFDAKGIPLNQIEERCHPHADGAPRKSTYLAIYRVLERLPISAMKAVYIVTDDARVLKIEPGPAPTLSTGLHLYQELTPMQPLVASSLAPAAFCSYITDQSQPVSVPAVAFCDLSLGDLRENPQFGMSDNLPYNDIPHLRDCLMSVWKKGAKDIKVVNRRTRFALPYRMIRSGVYVGSGSELVHFPFPKEEELENRYYEWWRSAQFSGQ
jgi:hypothetical protein